MATPVQARRRARLVFMLGAAVTTLLLATVAAADDVANSLDATVDATAETMALAQGGANGTTSLYVVPRNGDGKNGCNLTGSTTLTVSVASSDPSVATVTPSTITFASCGDTPSLTVTPHAEGTTTITAAQVSNTTGASFNLAPVTFTVTVSPPPNTPPQVSVSGVAGGATYGKGAVPAAICEVADSEDGDSSFAATLSAVTGAYAVDGIGQQTATCSYTDAGGLTAVSSATYAIADLTPPTVDAVVSPAAPDGLNGWYTTDVTLTWDVSEPDSPSSLERIGCVDQSIVADQAETSYGCEAMSAGGSSGQTSVSIKRDAHAPSLDCPAGPSGWQAENVVLTCSGSDVGPAGLSDPDDASFALSTEVAWGEEEAAAATGSRSVADAAGNTSAVGPFAFAVDRKAPNVSLTCPSAPILKGSSASAFWSATDGGSGLVGSTAGSLQLDTSGVGGQTATLADGFREDAVGNVSAAVTCAYDVVYDWAGFFRPIDNGVVNLAKSGSTIPVKFSLGGNQGLGILIAQPSTRTIACSAGASLDAIEEYATATVSGLKYDAAADQYIYNWKTGSSYAGTCQRLSVKLADGTTHTADFKFTK